MRRSQLLDCFVVELRHRDCHFGSNHGVVTGE